MENKNIKKEPSLSYNIQVNNNKNKEKTSSNIFNFKGNQKKVFIACCISVILIGFTSLLIKVTSSKNSNIESIAEKDIAIDQNLNVKNKDIESKKNEKNNETKVSFWGKIKNWFKLSSKTLDRPSFDIARTRDGDLLITGRAEANTKVYILKDERDFATETSDDNGEFVYIHKNKLPEGNAKFSMYIVGKDGNKIFSEQDVVFYISHNKSKDLAVLIGGYKKPSKVLQAPKNKYSSKFYLQNLDYDDQGNIIFSGVAELNTTLQIYLDNNLVASKHIDEKYFNISAESKNLEEGKKYTIRLDLVNNKNKVYKRMIYKFTPEFFKGRGNSYIVKYGDNLWNIAYSKYGKGSSYVVVFEGNKNQIVNPNLIYPNQVFTIPSKDSEFYNDSRRKYYK